MRGVRRQRETDTSEECTEESPRDNRKTMATYKLPGEASDKNKPADTLILDFRSWEKYFPVVYTALPVEFG